MGAHPAELHIKAPFPAAFAPLVQERARYKVYYGGRGGAKSWAFARALLLRGLGEPLRVLCTREVQSSMKESVHQLLKDQIDAMGLGPVAQGGNGHYRVLTDRIVGVNGTLFTFKGLSDPDALKSTEGVDVAWLEEAHAVSKGSWNKLDPTIRKPGSEIWISFNPELPTDYLYELFIKKKPPPRAMVKKVTYRDNPWLPAELRDQMLHMRENDFDEYLHVWEGFCRAALEGAVYAKELRTAQKEGRLTGPVPVDKAKPVHVFFDLGRGDMTAMWFVQIVNFQYRIIGYYQNNGFVWDHYLEHLEAERMRRGFYYGTIWLPHDADNELLGSRRTIKQQTEDANYRTKIVKKIGLVDGINAARTVFQNAYFDEDECLQGINCLRQYHYEVDDDGTRSKLPEHDWSSHGSDAWRYLGVALKEDNPKPKVKPKLRASLPAGRNAWMAR